MRSVRCAAGVLVAAGLYAQVPPAEEPGAAGRRFALILANGRYQKLPPLTAPSLDANLLRPVLEQAGFQVRLATDFTLAQLLKEIEPGFISQLKPRDVCFIFYAGHALQANEDNYIVPIDFDPGAAGGIDQRARSVVGLQQLLDVGQVGLKMIVLDAARQNPAVLSQSSGPGLTVPDVSDAQEIIYAFASSPNLIAPEPPAGKPDRFAAALASVMARPGMTAVELFSAVQVEVGRESSQQQIPFFLPKATVRFRFRAPAPVLGIEARREPGKDELRPNRRDRQEYVFVPAGTFKMGCVSADSRCEEHEKPQHMVKVSPGFWMGRTEVEISAYQRYVDADDKNRKIPSAPLWDRKRRLTNHPVTGADWEDAQAYCAWAGGRLPTEAEWEYAARAGAVDEVYPMNDENQREKANFSGSKGNDRFQYTAPVRSFDPNPFGIFDMAGNVWEWVQDWYSKTYYSESAKENPKGPPSGKSHVVRGGSWDSDPREHLRLSLRHTYPKAGNKVGFRCVLEDTPETKQLLF